MLRRSQNSESIQARRSRAQSMRRVIIKQGYLKKLPRIGSSFKVFYIMSSLMSYVYIMMDACIPNTMDVWAHDSAPFCVAIYNK